jgi:hypothetical protein
MITIALFVILLPGRPKIRLPDMADRTGRYLRPLFPETPGLFALLNMAG